jgi:hypothetical protein
MKRKNPKKLKKIKTPKNIHKIELCQPNLTADIITRNTIQTNIKPINY